MKNVSVKNFFREIGKNKGRFLSIFFIVLLGTAFFAGIRSSSSDMKFLADKYYRESKLMDMRVLTTLGITEEDIEDLQKTEEVETAEGGYTADMIVEREQELKVVKVIAATEKTNLPHLTEGRMPGTKEECLADFTLADELGYRIGDKVELQSGTDDDIGDTLNRSEFTITGIASLPYYIDLTRGSSNIGDGDVTGFIIVSPDVFESEVFTEGYLRLKGTEDLYAFSDEYEDTVEAAEDKVEEVLDKCADRRYEDITTDARKEIDDHKQEIKDAEDELADAKKELDENEEKLKDAEKDLDEARTELDDAKKEIDDGKKAVKDAGKEIADSEKELADGWEQYHDGKAKLESGREELGNAWQQYYDGQAELAAQEETLKAGRAELESAKAELEANEAAYEAQKAEYEAGEAQYAAGMELLKQDPDNVELQAQMAALRAQLDAAAPVIEAAGAQLAAAKQVLSEKETELAAGEAQIARAKEQAAAGYETLAAKQAEFEASEQQLAESYRTLADAQQKLDDGKAELEDKKKELADGEKEYKDGLAEYEDGLAEYEDGKKEWQDGYEEYTDSYDDAMEEIADGKKKIADAEEELADLEYPDTYVLSREKVASLVSFDGDADRIDRLSDVFPVIFFLVAALVSLTAMTRMVEEQRLEIGTLKALGAGDGSVAAKYICYAAIASLGGGIIGVFIGQRIIPAVVIDAYHSLYTGIPVGDYPFNVFWAVIAVIVATACTVIATILACRRALSDRPAVLMRPEAPKSGKRVIFEHFKGFWGRLNFSKKATIRNLFRYKKRFFMTIIGIGGCMALMLVGYGIQDSITGIAKLQYVEIFSQDATITLNTQASEAELQALEETVADYEGMTDYQKNAQIAVTLNANDTDRSAYLYIPEDIEKANDYVRLKDRQKDVFYDFPEEGALITEKTADMLGVKKGDTVEIRLEDDSEPASVKIDDIVENYVMHYLYISPDTYEELFGEPPEYNELLIKFENAGDEAYEKKLGEKLISSDACSAVEFVTDLKARIDDMLDSLNMVMWVLILSSAFLAFVVLYNLNSINMTERKRELATLKVLGFHDMEVAMYIYRENILLTVIGIVIGIFLGILMHRFLITTVEVDLMMFGRVINISSFLICALWTALFSVIVNAIMFWHFRKIDMIESLKSVE